MYILFDLDGTLTDPGLGITNSILYALAKMGLPQPPREDLYPFIGPPLTESFQKYCGMTESEANTALAAYREYFSTTGLFENEVYPGIPAMLQRLKSAGHILCLATSKPEIYARRILDQFKLSSYFTFAGGSELSGQRVAKAEVIRYVMAAVGASLAECIMIGDRRHDCEGAAACGIPAIGVLWGYGNEIELREAGAGRIVDSPAALLSVFSL